MLEYFFTYFFHLKIINHLARVRRFFGKPKKNDVFLKTEILVTRCYFWRKTGKNLERMGGGGGETKKIGILLKSNHTYMSLLQMNQVLA